MCGIAGIYQKNPLTLDGAILSAMSAQLAHRGPDDSGQFIDKSCGLAHRRLAIIDLSAAGHQPMTTPDGRYTIIFNGEIYNYRELRQKFLSHLPFVSESDTEVLLKLLAQRGVKALPLLRGMFAFAFWDANKRELLLARDHFGKKPLFYSDLKSTFVFASEPKALLQHPEVSNHLDLKAATKYFLYEYPPSPATGYRDIAQLPMGSYLSLTSTGFKVKPYWQMTTQPKLNSTEKNILKSLDTLLNKAVERRLISDRPVGLFLSGGLDSATIGWYMRQQTAKPLHSFNVSFKEPSFNESSFARQVAESISLEHHDIPFTVNEFRSALEEVAPLLDMPLADASLLPCFLMSKVARRHITVALDGDGGDELFGGYGTFKAARVASWFSTVPKSIIKHFMNPALDFLPTKFDDFSFDFKVKKFASGLPYSLGRRNQVWLGSFTDVELKHLLTPNLQSYVSEVFTDVDEVALKINNLSISDQVSLLTIRHYLHNDILVKLDRATMFNSVEARTPFLDLDLAEFALRLPDRWKRDKYILKKLMQNRISEVIIRRPKKGFGIPLGYWLKGPLYEWAESILSEEVIKKQNILQPAYVRRLLAEHHTGRVDHRKKLWTLLTWQLWYNRWAI